MSQASSQSLLVDDSQKDAKNHSSSSDELGERERQKGCKKKNKKDDDDIEERIRDLILITGGNGPKRWKQRKKEYMKKLENDNAELKNIIVDLQQKINAYQSQKSIVLDQLRYFQGCLDQAAPFILQQSEESKQDKKE